MNYPVTLTAHKYKFTVITETLLETPILTGLLPRPFSIETSRSYFTNKNTNISL